MRLRRATWAGFLCVAASVLVAAQGERRTLVLISIDGLAASLALDPERQGVRLPNLGRLRAEGAYATGVAGVLPSMTYPSHATLVTGVAPSRHGILGNRPFEPERNESRWYWYSEDLRVPALWDAARDAGIETASVDWPVTVGAPIAWNIAQYWQGDAPGPDAAKLVRALSTRGLLAEAEARLGDFPPGPATTLEADRRRAAFSAWILENKRPGLHLAYFSSFDEAQHRLGPGSPEALRTLAELDRLVGELRASAEEAGGGRALVAVVSDHGFALTRRELHLNAALAAEGLLSVGPDGRVASWRALARGDGGTAAIRLADAGDAEAASRVEALLRRLASGPRPAVARVLSSAQARASGGFPDAAFVACFASDVRFGFDLEGDSLRDAPAYGSHGFHPSDSRMDAVFFLAGPGVPHRNLGRIDLRDVAPTLAGRLGLGLASAEGHDLLGARIRHAERWARRFDLP